MRFADRVRDHARGGTLRANFDFEFEHLEYRVRRLPAPTYKFSTSQVQTSTQNPVFGSVPEAKPTLDLPLTFSDAIERALRQNLAGLLSEYNTIEARGEKWQQLSDLLPKVNA